jgi:hypothetical protein
MELINIQELTELSTPKLFLMNTIGVILQTLGGILPLRD